MPLFMVYRPIFECIADGTKTIEVRNRLIRGDNAVFQCGRQILRKKIARVTPFKIDSDFFSANWKKMIPRASDEADAMRKLLEIFPNSSEFYGYEIE